ncbi:hypothetical protein P170DRAFT_431974 [Aspergillus steynii IBT 23096]|uniref:Uncharacterized protein n=1 Tax=Aspergillus steynii IBT 23096 TaxID=1392250 RepID=A0A2I2GN96_9EURO|nr:uncharacterized protein P170DRAFT_431974 [Aspergillus steynii IBT 23096]PLB54343.1 hypothetical protein P170DRAFT_431974 [Aspergillus steynii IBT 23096]
MSLPALSRATLFPLILNPLLVSSARASTALAHHSVPTTSLHFIHSQSPSRLGAFSVFHPQCPSDSLFYLSSTSASPHQAKSYATMSTDASKNQQQQQQQQQEEEGQQASSSGHPLALPDASTADSQAPKLDVSGGDSTVTLDHLGPMVVNQDGSLSRITNWGQMTEIEKKNTLRVLGKRNKLRLEAVKAAGGGE